MWCPFFNISAKPCSHFILLLLSLFLKKSSECGSAVSTRSSLSEDEDMGWSFSWPPTAWHCFLKGRNAHQNSSRDEMHVSLLGTQYWIFISLFYLFWRNKGSLCFQALICVSTVAPMLSGKTLKTWNLWRKMTLENLRSNQDLLRCIMLEASGCTLIDRLLSPQCAFDVVSIRSSPWSSKLCLRSLC